MHPPSSFATHDEPYLGRKSLYVFDVLISSAIDQIAKAALAADRAPVGSIGAACRQLIPSGVSISLGIRELLRQGHLYSSYVLVRPLAERAFTALYLFKVPAGLTIWNNGWQYSKRPKLPEIMRILDEKGLLEGANALSGLNELIHGSPASSSNLAFVDHDGEMKIAVGPNLARPDLCDEVCDLTICMLPILMGVSGGVFGQEGANPTC